MSADHVRYSLLGPVRAWRGNVELPLGWPKQRAVLAMLLLNANRLVTRDAIVDGVWGEEAPASAVNLVHTYIAGLRRVLEPGRPPRGTSRRLEQASSGYVLRLEAGQLDLDEFYVLLDRARASRASGDLAGVVRASTSALNLWEPPPLAGIPGPVAGIERTRLAELRLTTVENRAEALLNLGRHHELASELLALTAEYPLRERISALLMTALYRCGRQAEALEVYARARSLLAEELGIDPGPELQRLHVRILAGDLELAADRDSSGGATGADAAAPAPHELPADIPHFVGRTEQLGKLTAALETTAENAGSGGTVVIGAIDGMGGVGKSALAIHAAHRLADAGRFPDGELYVNLQGATPGLEPLDPLDVLGRVLRALGASPGRIPGQLDEAAAMFRTLTKDRQLLLVLDDARDAAQVHPLLPGGAACRALVTSRQVLATLDHCRCELVHLSVLSEAEGMELLGRLVGPQRTAADRDAAVEVVRWCGHLPLAIRIAAARMTARPNWPVRELADRLAAADATRRLEELAAGELGVRSSFDVSLYILQHSPDAADQAAARAFGLLSLSDGPDLDIGAAAALLGQSQPAAESLLERLVDSQLLLTPRPRRYKFHDLLRLYARQHAIDDQDPEAAAERSAAMTRLLGWYTATAWHTLALLRPGDGRLDTVDAQWAEGGHQFPGTAAALTWLETERANLLAALEQAAATPAIPGRVAFQLTSGLYGFFLVHGYWADGASANRTMLDLARRLGDRAAEARAHIDLGTFCRWLGQYQEALHHHEQGLALARELGDRRGQSRSLDSLGIVHWRLGHYENAIACHEQSLALARQLGHRRDQASSLGNLGNVYDLVGRYEEALACHQDSVTLFRQLGDRRGQAGSLVNLGEVWLRLERYQDAIISQQESRQLFRELWDRSGEALSLNILGRAYLSLGRCQEAIACQQDSLQLSRELGERHGWAAALRDLGDALLALGHPGRARHAWQEALSIFEELHVPEADQLHSRLAAAKGRIAYVR